MSARRKAGSVSDQANVFLSLAWRVSVRERIKKKVNKAVELTSCYWTRRSLLPRVEWGSTRRLQLPSGLDRPYSWLSFGQEPPAIEDARNIVNRF
jgi:hypothetical protein